MLPENHGLLFEFDGEATTIESVPRAEHYNLSCADDGHTLPFGQNVRVSCIKFDPGQEPASIEVKGCHKPCSVVSKTVYFLLIVLKQCRSVVDIPAKGTTLFSIQYSSVHTFVQNTHKTTVQCTSTLDGFINP